MCRFIFYTGPELTLASLITEPSHSLIRQSTSSRESEEPLNGDGFGVAWYVPELSPTPAVFRSVTPAWSNQNLLHMARVTRSKTVLAHVRAATSGLPVTELNCHPFVFDRYAFMHNGDVGGFGAIRRKILDGLSDVTFDVVRGSTDSEHLFGMFLDRAAQAEGESDDMTEVMGEALTRTVADVLALQKSAGVREPNYLNIAVTDGTHAVALRYTNDKPEDAASLHIHAGRRYECVNGACRMVAVDRHPTRRSMISDKAVIVSSEPLSDDAGWDMVPANHMVLVRSQGMAELRTLAV